MIQFGWIICGLCLTRPVGAQAPPNESTLVLVVEGGAEPDMASLLLPRLVPVGQRMNASLTTDAQAWALPRDGGFDRERLGALQQLDELLARAQAEAANLDEGAALASLAGAARLGANLLDLPGIAAWQAEIEMRTGLVAAQAGRPKLAEAALRRAASLDLERRLMAAEATPEVVALADRIWQQTRSAAEGRVLVTSGPPGAQVFLDDVALGATPLTVSARVGRHILRLEAPGTLAYGTFVDLMAGERPPIRIVLSPNRAADALAQLQRAAAQGRAAEVLEAIGLLWHLDGDGGEAGPQQQSPRSVLLVQVGTRADRLLVQSCTRNACAPAQAWQDGERVPPSATGAVGHRDALRPGTPHATAWLDERPQSLGKVSTGGGWADRTGWLVWGSAAAATAVAAVLTALLVNAQQSPTRELTVTVDPGDARR